MCEVGRRVGAGLPGAGRELEASQPLPVWVTLGYALSCANADFAGHYVSQCVRPALLLPFLR